ncbi:MAG: hypothetical protein IPH18_08625 [Chitinophagaceae bacterium]|nr:hypothetical protein [Chitinophagaceae bacterium]
MQLINLSNITTNNISLPSFSKKEVRLDVLRTDKIHPVVSGNKWFKLRYYLEKAAKLGKTTIVTKGGPWSNHIVATAAACKQSNFNSIGIIRGERPPKPSVTMLDAMRYGMELVFISRKHFSENKLPAFITNNEVLFIDYGGYGTEGAEGAATILDYCAKENYTHIYCSAGSGTMLAGLVNAAAPGTFVTGISSMKNNNSLETEIKFYSKKRINNSGLYMITTLEGLQNTQQN